MAMLSKDKMTSRVRSSAAILLGNILKGNQDMSDRPDFGIIQPLIDLVKCGNPDEKTSAMWALSRFNCRQSNVKQIVTRMGAIAPMRAILAESVNQGLSSDDLLLDVL